MTFKALCRRFAAVRGIPIAQSRSAILALVALIGAELQQRDGRVEIPGFGVFDCRYRRARVVDFGDGYPAELPETREPRFRAAAALKSAVRNARVFGSRRARVTQAEVSP